MRLLRRVITTFGIILGVYFVAAVVGAVIPGKTATIIDAPRDVRVLMISGPIHVDFLLPADAETLDRFEFAGNAGVPVDHPDVHWLVVGWGARAFYTTAGSYQDVRLSAVVKGITGDESVMRIDVAGELPADFPVIELWLSQPQYTALLNEILSAFEIDAQTGAPQNLGLGLGQNDAFFASPDQFHIFRTCNTWVGRTLRASGIRSGIWTPLPYSVTLSHWLWHPTP